MGAAVPRGSSVTMNDQPLEDVAVADVGGVVVAVVNEKGQASQVMGAPRHPVPDDYKVDPELPGPPASTLD